MATAVSSRVLFSGKRKYAISLFGEDDATGETAAVKVDISTLTGPDGTAPTSVVVEEIWWDVQGIAKVELYFDKTVTDERIQICSGQGYVDFRPYGGLAPSAAAGTNDIIQDTAAAALGTYSITMNLRLKD